MKKIVVILLVVCLFVGLCGCDSSDYKKAMDLFNSGNYESAMLLFESLADYKDSAMYVNECKYNIALGTLENDQFSEAAAQFEAIKEYKDSATMVQECFYQEAIALAEAGDVIKAHTRFTLLKEYGYKDSAKRLEEIYFDYKVETIKSAEVGNLVCFGTMDQDHDFETEDIVWRVLDKTEEKILLISAHGLDGRKYHTESLLMQSIPWHMTTLCQWLNDDFYNTVFTNEEKSIISDVTVESNIDVQNKVFILNITEAEKYFASNEDRVCYATILTAKKDILIGSDGSCCWWLRTPAKTLDNVPYVDLIGEIDADGAGKTYSYIAVRPAIWIDLSAMQ